MPDLETAPPGVVVKHIVGRILRGRVATYGTIGRVAAAVGRPIGGARTVAWILASLKGKDNTPWQRVVGAGGVILLPDRRGAIQATRLRREGVRFVKEKVDPRCVMAEGALIARLTTGRWAAR